MRNFNFHKYQLPPQNYLAEEILLGIMIVYPNMICHILPLVKSEYFFLEYHQLIYEYLIEIYKKNNLNISEFLYSLIESKILHKIGGVNKILDLIKQSQIFILTSYNINLYIKEIINIIQYNYVKRLLIQYGYYIIQLAYMPSISNYKLYNKASNYLNFIENRIPKSNTKTINNLITELLLKVQTNKSNKTNNLIKKDDLNIESGLHELDQLVTGLMGGDLIVIAGRPGMGKTSLAINIAYNILSKFEIGICIFSLEMSSKQIINKFISIYSKVETKKILLNNLNINEWKKIVIACNQLLKGKIYIYDNGEISIDYIEYTSKILIKEKSYIKLLIIDYLQLIQVNLFNTTNRTQELSYITRKLKLLSQHLNIPIIVLSQLNRSIESRSFKKPILSDLKESGCIDTKCNIDTIYNIHNNINIINLLNYSQLITFDSSNKIFTISNKKNLINIYKTRYIYLSIQYAFRIRISGRLNLYITHNHKIFYYKYWHKVFSILDGSLRTKRNINHIKYNFYIHKIIYYKYTQLYDINMQNYFNFISNNIILHNSIEQDADIVMMLYQQEKDNNLLDEKIILDIVVCKNRNGAIGEFKLNFIPEISLFQNINNYKL